MSTTNSGSQALGGIRVRDRASAPPADRRRRHSGIWRRAVSPIAILILWQLTHVFKLVSTQKLPPPTQVVHEAWTLITVNSPAYGGTLQHALLVSLGRWGLGFAFGGAAAVVLAIVAGLSRAGEDGVDPLLQMVRTLPLFGLVPVFIVWFGIGTLPKILLIALAAVIPLYLNAFSGIRGVDGRLLELARSLGLSRRETLVHIVLPSALPATLVGVRQSLGVSILALVVAEQVNANAGLGYMIDQAQNFSQNDVIFVALIVYTIFGLLTDWIVRIAERRALGWRDAAGVR